jgi:putative CocE/NonD family hydrolase
VGFRVEKDVMVSMRDGTELATDVWVPDAQPAPTLIVRHPYGKNLVAGGVFGFPILPNIFALLDAGYAVVWQDCRGAFGSAGRFIPMVDEPSDGADTIAWVRSQEWCDGKIGTYGLSYLGFTQWAAAGEAPEGLAAIAPCMTGTDYYLAPWYSEGGAMSYHAALWWSSEMTLLEVMRQHTLGEVGPEAIDTVAHALAEVEAQLCDLPGEQKVLEAYCPWWTDWIANADRNSYWSDLATSDRTSHITTPALHIGGWFDIFVNDTARAFTRMRAGGGSAEAREGQRLIIGPWDHLNYTGIYHDRQFGMSADVAAADLTTAHISFYDRWLKDDAEALAGSAPVRIFVMGTDEWRDEADWPLPDTDYVAYYLDGAGRANTRAGDGVLSPTVPSADAVDSFAYDPTDPVPTLGGRIMRVATLNAAGPVDQQPVEDRLDVLCFTTPVLAEPVEVTGHVSLVLHVRSSATDTDFTAKLVDVFPDGQAIYLTDGIMRCRYRDSLAVPTPLEPHRTYELTVDLAVTSNVFLPGHQIRLEVASSNFPRFDRNTNTGGDLHCESLADAVVAVNEVLHGPSHPSRLVLPVIPRRPEQGP